MPKLKNNTQKQSLDLKCGDKVYVHWNRLKKMWSCKLHKYHATTQYTQELILINYQLYVQPGGYIRYQRTGIRNVHAYIKGEYVDNLMNLTHIGFLYYDINTGLFGMKSIPVDILYHNPMSLHFLPSGKIHIYASVSSVS